VVRIRCLAVRVNQAVARNRGMSMVDDGWVSFVDADDTMHPERMATISRHIQRQPELRLVLHGYARRPSKIEHTSVTWGVALFDIAERTKASRDWIIGGLMHSMSTVHRDVLDSVRFRTEPEFYRREDSVFVHDVIHFIGRRRNGMLFDSAKLGIYSPRPINRKVPEAPFEDATARNPGVCVTISWPLPGLIIEQPVELHVVVDVVDPSPASGGVEAADLSVSPWDWFMCYAIAGQERVCTPIVEFSSLGGSVLGGLEEDVLQKVSVYVMRPPRSDGDIEVRAGCTEATFETQLPDEDDGLLAYL